MPSFARKVSAYFIVKDAARAIDFYKEAFGATEVFRMTDPSDGRIGHAELRFGETLMMLADEYPDFGALSRYRRRLAGNLPHGHGVDRRRTGAGAVGRGDDVAPGDRPEFWRAGGAGA